MRDALWRSVRPLCVQPDSTDLTPLFIQWEKPDHTVLTLSAIYITPILSVRLRWAGLSSDMYTTLTGTWVPSLKHSDKTLLTQNEFPLTQSMLCADNCAPLMEILYHDHGTLLRLLDSTT